MRCPTGALQFERKDDGPAEPIPAENIILITPDGPLYVRGDVEITAGDGSVLCQDTRVALLGKYAARPIRLFWIISGVIFAFSFIFPITLPATIAASTKIGLSVMHIIAWPAIAVVLTMQGREQ